MLKLKLRRMQVINEFISNFPYVDLTLLERLSEEIDREKPHLAFVSRFIRNIISGKYINEPIQLMRSIMRVLIPEDEDEKTLVTFVYLHPIIGLLVAPVVLHDFASEEAFTEFIHIAKHVYLVNYDLICYSINLLLSLKKHKKQSLETLRFFAMAISKLSNEIVLLASSENKFNECLELINCGIKASNYVNDENSLILMLKSKGDLLSFFDKKKEAAESYEEIINRMKNKKDLRSKMFIQGIYVKMISVLLDLGEAEKALKYIEELDKISSKMRRLGLSSRQDLAILYFYKGRAYKLLKNFKEAGKFLEKALKYVSNVDFTLRKKIIEELISVYESLGRKDKIEKLLKE